MMVDGWPCKIILKGDSQAAGALLPYAGQVAKQMNACRIRNKTVKVKDATIQIRIDPPAKLFTIQIESGSWYMESGFHDLKGAIVGDVDSYKAASIIVPSSISTDRYNASKVRTVVTGDTSLSVGGRNLSTTYNDGYYDFSSSDKEFGDKYIRERKAVRTLVAPSTYTGLMCKYIQSLYGTQRTDYTYIQNPDLLTVRIAISPAGKNLLAYTGNRFVDPTSSVPLYNSFNGTGKTSGIIKYTNTDNSVSYFLVTLGTSSITYRKLRDSSSKFDYSGLDPEGSYVIDDSVSLSSKSPSGTELTMQSDGMLPSASSVCPAYGWKFNAAGDEAVIVLCDEVTAGTGLAFESSLFSAKFSFSTVDGAPVPSCTITQSSAGVFYPSSAANFLVPGLGPGNSKGLIRFAPGGASGQFSPQTATVYAFYDSDDVIQYVTLTAGEQTTIAESWSAPPDKKRDPSYIFGGLGPSDSGSSTKAVGEYGIVRRTADGVSVGALDLNKASEWETGNHEVIQASYSAGPPNADDGGWQLYNSVGFGNPAYYVNDGYQSIIDNIVNGGSGLASIRWVATKYGGSGSGVWTLSTPSSYTSSSSVVIPYGDASAAFAVTLDTTQEPHVTTWTASQWLTNSPATWSLLDGGAAGGFTWGRFGTLALAWGPPSTALGAHEFSASIYCVTKSGSTVVDTLYQGSDELYLDGFYDSLLFTTSFTSLQPTIRTAAVGDNYMWRLRSPDKEGVANDWYSVDDLITPAGFL
jgi:hypothetical protein